jgi:hypothetical protein
MAGPAIGSLFAGIGGIEIGLERAGFETAWQVERDEFCSRILARHWPSVTRYGDIHDVDPRAVTPVDILAGGFPCQPVSLAGLGRGRDDPRWLWPEFARLIRDLRPGIVFVENVVGLRNRGFGLVVGDLAALGYDAEWECIPAGAVGAPHRRDRIWLVAYPQGELLGARLRTRFAPGLGRRGLGDVGQPDPIGAGPGGTRAALADGHGAGLAVGSVFGGDARAQLEAIERGRRARGTIGFSQSDVGRTLNGFSAWLDRRDIRRAAGVVAKFAHDRGASPAVLIDEARVWAHAGQMSGPSAEVPLSARDVFDRFLDGLADKVDGADMAAVRMPEPVRAPNRELELAWFLARESERTWIDRRWTVTDNETLLDWLPGWEDGIGRTAFGVPGRIERVRACGNAVVPAAAEFVGRRIRAVIEANWASGAMPEPDEMAIAA